MTKDRTSRRAFLERAVSTLGAAALVLQGEAQVSVQEAQPDLPVAEDKLSGGWRLDCAGWRLSLTKDGDILSLKSGTTELVNRRLGSSLPRIVVAGEMRMDCSSPKSSRRAGSKIYFEYEFGSPYPLTVEYDIGLQELTGKAVALEQTITFRSERPLKKNVVVHLPKNIQLPASGRKVFLPLKNGIGRRKPLSDPDNKNGYKFQFAGGATSSGLDWADHLAIPLIDEYCDSTSLHSTVCADPLFSTFFRLALGDAAGDISWVYTEPVGISQPERRSFYTILHTQETSGALNLFYETALADVKPGPAWLHDMAMVHYDYLSNNGTGWYAEIDALTKLIAREDRHRVVMTIHGWYDLVGRYTFDQRTRTLDSKWIAFPSVRDPMVQSLGDGPDSDWHVKNLQPVEMSLAEMHKRIRYAKDRGFRVILYYADALNVCEGVGETYKPDRILKSGGWTGPDTKGPVSGQNPLHPAVHDFFVDYLQALLEEYGKEIDGFVWDETYVVEPGNLGTEQIPGYADRAFMLLVKELTAAVTAKNPNLAFLTADCMGAFPQFADKAPYCLFAHGTYQDTQCTPQAWPYSLFPNYRNVLWGCSWNPVTNLPLSEYAVKTFGVPVPVGVAMVGDNTGFAEMKPQDVQKIMALFAHAKAKPLKITWIEEKSGPFLYNGQEVTYRDALQR